MNTELELPGEYIPPIHFVSGGNLILGDYLHAQLLIIEIELSKNQQADHAAIERAFAGFHEYITKTGAAGFAPSYRNGLYMRSFDLRDKVKILRSQKEAALERTGLEIKSMQIKRSSLAYKEEQLEIEI